MLEIRMRVGPKGQVVIPKVFRDAFKIDSGTEVTFSVEGDKLVVRTLRSDAVDVLEKIAESGKSVDKVHPHAAYDREVQRRHL